MDRAGVRTSRGLLCPECEAELDRHEDPGSARGTGDAVLGAEPRSLPDAGTRAAGPDRGERTGPGAAARRLRAGLAQLGVAAPGADVLDREPSLVR